MTVVPFWNGGYNCHCLKISTHAILLNDLDKDHQRTAGRVEHVASQVGNLKTDVNHMEGRLRGEVKSKVCTPHLTRKKLSTNSPWDFEYVFETMDDY